MSSWIEWRNIFGSLFNGFGYFALRQTNTMQEKVMSEEKRGEAQKMSWGPKLFIATFVGIMLFFYWLLIYSGGVVVHHG